MGRQLRMSREGLAECVGKLREFEETPSGDLMNEAYGATKLHLTGPDGEGADLGECLDVTNFVRTLVRHGNDLAGVEGALRLIGVLVDGE